MGAFDKIPKGLTLKRREFDVSGTFTPTAKHLALGGWVKVMLYGGGGAGYRGDWTYQGGNPGMGGMAGGLAEGTIALTAAVTVTIGGARGHSTFGTKMRAKGGVDGGSFNGSWYAAGMDYGYPELNNLTPIGAWGTNQWMLKRWNMVASDTQLVDGWGQNSPGNKTRGGAPGVWDGVQYSYDPGTAIGKAGYRGSGGGGGNCWTYNLGEGADNEYYNSPGGAGGNGYCLVEWYE